MSLLSNAALEKGGVSVVDNDKERGIMAPRSTGIGDSDMKWKVDRLGIGPKLARLEIQQAAPAPAPEAISHARNATDSLLVLDSFMLSCTTYLSTRWRAGTTLG